MNVPSRPAGYSGKPAWQKLGLATDLRIRVLHAPGDYEALVGARDLRIVSARAGFEFAHVFAKSASALRTDIAAIAKHLPATGVLWVSWPKKASGVETDIVEDRVREIALPLGLVDVKVCAIDATWSGLKLVWRREVRAGKR